MWSKLDSEGAYWIRFFLLVVFLIGLVVVCITTYNIKETQSRLETNKIKLEMCTKLNPDQQLDCIKSVNTSTNDLQRRSINE